MTGQILAAVDADPAATGVIAVTRALARLLDLTAHAVHVSHGCDATVRSRTDAQGLELACRSGRTVDTLVAALEEAGVEVGVCGARRAAFGSTPAGTTALGILATCATPLVVVPPTFEAWSDPDHLEILAPIDGTQPTATSMRTWIDRFSAAGQGVTVLHVLALEAAPPFLDQPHHALRAWGEAFLSRSGQSSHPLELRTGDAPREIAAAVREHHPDLVLLAWTQHLATGRAQVVRELLAAARRPVLIIPARLESEGTS